MLIYNHLKLLCSLVVTHSNNPTVTLPSTFNYFDVIFYNFGFVYPLPIVDIDYSITSVFRPSYLLDKGLIYCLCCLFAFTNETSGIFPFIIFIFLVVFSFLLKKAPSTSLMTQW